MTAAVSIRSLAVERGGRMVLPGLSLDVARGKVTGLLGPSGSGKSTLMRAIVGVQRLQSGTVTVLGEPAGSPRLRHRVAYMTQSLSVYMDLTVRENLRYFARLLGAPADRVADVLAAVELEGEADRRVDSLSGGQQARVSLAAALVGEPELLVLDEPTVGLDPLLRRDLWALFRSQAEAGRTLIVSSHVMDEAAHCDGLVLLREGSVLADAAPEWLLRSTGARDLESAFVTLIERGVRA
jgi:ABC-2 type transport system ATP-binding protein